MQSNNSPAPTIAVIGPGALGTLFAARLILAGLPAILLDYRPERARLLNERGIRLLAPREEHRVSVPTTADPRELSQCEAAIILVKAYQLEPVADQLARYLPANAVALTLQNGLGNVETLQLHLGYDRVFGGVTSQGAILESPGVVRDTGEGQTVLGRSDGQPDPRLDDLCQALLLAGFTVSITSDLAAALWTKAILNAAINPIAALTRLRNGQLIDHEPSLRLMTAAAREAAQIARKHKVNIPVQDWRARLQTICRATAPNINSMLADILHHRRTEIKAITGAIVRTAELHHLTAPVNRTLLYALQTIEQSYDDQLTARCE